VNTGNIWGQCSVFVCSPECNGVGYGHQNFSGPLGGQWDVESESPLQIGREAVCICLCTNHTVQFLPEVRMI